MFSKNNKNMYLKKMENRILKFSIKKLNVGVASVLVGVGIMFGSSQIVSASEVDSTLITMSKTIEESNEEIEQDKGQTLEEATAKASDSVNVLVDESLTEESNEEIEQDKGQTLEEATAKASDSVSENVLVDESLTEESNEEIEQDKGQTLEEATAKASDSVSENVLVDGKIKENNKRKVDIGITEVKEGATLANKDISRVRAKRSFSMENTDKQKETEINVSEWSSLIQALSDNQYSIINVSGLINATGNDIITGDGRNVTVRGIQGSTINFNNNIIKAQGTNWNLVFDNLNISTGNSKGTVDFIATNGHNTITFKDINASGTSLYGGGGDTTVIIDGTTTSTVDNASIGKTNSYTSTSREANIHSTKELIVNDGASFTLNRSSIGDGINLPDGATVRVGNNAVFNVNMNTKNGKESARYHNAGIFMLNGGTFITGRKSVVNMHTSIGQAVSIGVKRPSDSVTDKDRFGGYTSKQSRNEGVTVVTLGNQSIFNFIGRDGFILGNNATFTSGEYSKVHFKNKGRGVALDLANNSDIIISKHSNTFFESDGKTGNPPSGSYDGYNYIGVNEGGNITIDEYATFRVILKNRGDNAWDDVITLDSRKPGTSAAFVSKKGAVVDIRDDNTNFYAELISFPLGEANSKIDIQSPLYLNLQRYSSDGSTAGWMSVGGVSINTTSNAYTANLIYMGGSKGTLRIGGTDYVVYQQIKSNGSKQIWLNVQDVTFKKNGFANIPKNNNGANPDLSISGNDLVAGIEANRVKEDPTDPTKGNNAPYYGISSMRANHQIWFPHSTSNQASGLHKNVIRYIYEDGTPILDNIGQPLVVKQETDWVREFVLSIPDEKLRKVQEYGATHTADEILEYVKNLYTVSEDSGWRLDNTVNTHDAYDAVNSPELEGYTAKIKSSNVNGLSVGDIATVVKVNLNLPDTIVNKGQLSEEYKQNGITGIPEDYETVVIYVKDEKKSDQKAVVKYIDKTDGNKLLESDETVGKSGEKINYSTDSKIKELTDKGYVLVKDGFPKDGIFDDNDKEDQIFEVILEHGVAPVGPNDPHEPGTPINPMDPEGPKWLDKDNYSKEYTSTIHYVDEKGNTVSVDNVQTSVWGRTLQVDKVTGEILNPDEAWVSDKQNYDEVKTPTVNGYYADKVKVPSKAVEQQNLTETVVYKPLGKVVPVDPEGNLIPGAETPIYTNDPKDPTKGGETPIPEIPGYRPEIPGQTTVVPKDPGKDTPIIYVKDEKKSDQKAVVKYIDKTDGNKLLESDETVGKSGEKINYSTDSKIKELTDKGYVLVKDGFPKDGIFDDNDKEDQIFEVILEHGVAPVGPNDPHEPGTPINPMDPEGPKWLDKDNYSKEYTSTIHYVDEKGNTVSVDNVQTSVWGRTLQVDKVTGEILNPDEAWVSDKQNYDEVKTPTVNGYYADKVKVPSKAVEQQNLTETVVYKPLGKVVPVDPEGNLIPGAETPIYTNDPKDPTKGGETPIPEIPGYRPEIPGQTTVVPKDPGKDTPIIYVKDEKKSDQKAVVKYIDKTDGNKLLESDETVGKSGEKINYSTDSKIKELTDKGYVLVKDGFPKDGIFDDNDKEDQIFEVILEHGVAPVGPNDPHEPGTPINPMDPEGPKWLDKDNYSKEYTSTIHYVDEKGNTVSVDNVQTSVWGRTLQVDKVTGEILNPDEAWVSDKQNYDEVKTPTVNGYYADKVKVPSKAVEQQNLTETVVYKPLGKVVPVDPEGNLIPGAETPIYTNDPKDPTKGGETPIPEIPGYRPEIPGQTTVVPKDPGKDTPIIYVKDEKKSDQKAVVKYIDKTDGNKLLESDETVGKSGEKINYSTDSKIKELTDKGYVLVKDGFPKDGIFDDNDKEDQIFEVILEHGVAPVGPNDPHEPGTPINPMDPEGPKWLDKDNYSKEYTSTIHYVDEKGNTVSVDNVQTSVWGRTLQVDKVTGEILNPDEAWVSDKQNYDEVKTPTVNGYYADKVKVPSKAVEQQNLTETVVYKPLGKVVPVDPEGNLIPGAETPIYTNDPKDPTKGGETPIPEIPGYRPEIPGQTTVVPKDPGKDTPIIYVKDEKKSDQKAVVKYIDKTDGNKLLESDETVGKSGEKINYSTDSKIKELTDKGYVLVKDGFPKDGIFDDNDKEDQIFEVILEHGVAPVGPNDPHEPGTPINPMDPEGPKWLDKDNYSKEYTSTIHYVDEKGNTVSVDNVQTSVWGRTLQVDKVTGEILNPDEAWVSDKQNYDEVKTPTVNGYYADKVKVPSKAVEQQNLTETVVYKPLGKVVPVDPEGNLIPGAETPIYTNDPKDPTKGGETPIPEIPGYRPEIPGQTTVVPKDPGKDTPIIYVKDEKKSDQKAVVKYIDKTDGNKLLESDETVGKSGEKINYSTDSKIKELTDKGYVLVKDGFPKDGIFDDNDKEDQIFEVILEHGVAPVGPNDPHEPGTPINPMDPEGPKWLDKDNYSKEYTSTIHYVDEKGNTVSVDNVQTSVWGRTLQVDKVTGEILNPDEAWVSDKQNYDEVKTPTVNGYYADKVKVPSKAVEQQNLTETVVYKPLGKVVPVDPEGNLIPGAETPIYTNDPKDPTKGGETPIPEIPGYRPEIPGQTTVVPKDPGKDTPKEFPRTGETKNHTIITSGVIIVLSILGLLGYRKKQKDD